MKTRIIGFVAIVTVLVLVLMASQHRVRPLMVSGFIESDEIRLGSRVGGRVARVHVEEGQQVTKGDVLVELEPYDLVEREAQYQANYDQARAEHDKLSRGFRDEEKAQARARVDQLAARLLKLRNGPRPQEIEAARADLKLAQATLDLAQEAFLAAHRSWDRVSGYDEPGAWVRRVVTNLSVSMIRRRAVEAKALARTAVGAVPPLPALSTEDVAFWAAVRKLPRRQAQVIALHYLEDRSVVEVARILDIAEGTVKKHLHDGRLALVRRLGLDGEEDA